MALLVDPPEPLRPKCRLAGASPTSAPASASHAHRRVHGGARVPTRAAQHCEPEQQRRDAGLREARDQAAQQPGEHRRADEHVALRRPHSTIAVVAIITSARKRP